MLSVGGNPFRAHRRPSFQTWAWASLDGQTELTYETLQSTLEPIAGYLVDTANGLAPGAGVRRVPAQRPGILGGMAAGGISRWLRVLHHSRLHGHAGCHPGASFSLEHAAATDRLAVGACRAKAQAVGHSHRQRRLLFLQRVPIGR